MSCPGASLELSWCVGRRAICTAIRYVHFMHNAIAIVCIAIMYIAIVFIAIMYIAIVCTAIMYIAISYIAKIMHIAIRYVDTLYVACSYNIQTHVFGYVLKCFVEMFWDVFWMLWGCFLDDLGFFSG